MAKAIGIGGVFLQFKGDKQKVMDWYEQYLGMDMTHYGTGFTGGIQYVLLSFDRADDVNMPLLNLRVDDIESMLKVLKKEDIHIVNEITEHSYGKFLRFLDPFGNLIELWEIDSDAYIDMVEKEVKEYRLDKDNKKVD